MAGIYIHIPFCRKSCSYCDFYYCLSLIRKKEVIESLQIEIENRKTYLGGEEIETIYFGGGTPTVLTVNEIDAILRIIKTNFNVTQNAEITIEANPDDLSKDYIQKLSKTSFNRLSIGVQSFHNEDLRLMNRRHSSIQAIESIKYSNIAGFNNISIDLIYGTPLLTYNNWMENIQMAVDLKVNHISAYHLTYEPGTVLWHKINKKRLTQANESASVEQHKFLYNCLQKNGYYAYEISNFAKAGFESRHNSNYWKQKKYLGIGPSAHSFNGISRQWNIKNIKKYTQKILFPDKYDIDIFETENLTPVMKYNEYILTGLRTRWGISSDYIKNNFDKNIITHFFNAIKKLLDNEMIKSDTNQYFIPENKILVADSIILAMIMD